MGLRRGSLPALPPAWDAPASDRWPGGAAGRPTPRAYGRDRAACRPSQRRPDLETAGCLHLIEGHVADGLLEDPEVHLRVERAEGPRAVELVGRLLGDPHARSARALTNLVDAGMDQRGDHLRARIAG